MKRITSIVLAFLMLVSIIPSNLAYAQEGQKLDVVLLSNGRYMIKLPGVDYARAKQVPDLPDIDPTKNPRDFENRTIKVGIADLVKQATGVKSLEVEVSCVDANYVKKYTGSVSDWDTGIKVPIPREKWTPIVNVKFDDGRDSRYLVEAHMEPTNVVNINIDLIGHSGVATRWYGKADKPDVQANFVGLNKTAHLFNLPKVDQNSVLRQEDEPWQWAGHDNIVNLKLIPIADLRHNDSESAKDIYLEIKGAKQGQLASSKYHFHITGDSYHGFTATMREKNTVDFEAGKGTWKTEKPAQQFAANGLKLKDTFMEAPDTIGPVKVPDGDKDLTPPKAEKDKPENVFKGWATTADGPVVDMDTFVVEGDTTFHAIYGPKDQGKIKVEYKDSKTNAAIDSKYQLKGQEYPAEKPGNKGEAIKDEVFDQEKAPKFLGYKIKSITTNPVPNPPATANYTKDGDYTVIYTYDKLPDVIPEKKNGQDNPDVTPDVKEHYAKLTFQVATADAEKAKLQLAGQDATSPLVYYVNPLEGKTIAQVADVKALSKDDNLYKVDANDMWTYNPDTITSTGQVISQATDDDGNVKKTEITLTAKVADKTAAKFKDKLKPVDIKVWEDKTDTDGSKIDWKKGVALKVKDDTLQEILDKAETKVTDENNRNSSTANLPNGQKGNLKVTFEDGSSLEVKDQTLYVAPHKNDDNTNLPKDAVQVDFKIGEGVTGTEKTEYVKPGTDVKADAPKVTLNEGFKDAKWYKGDAEAADADYQVTAKAVFTAKATGKDKVVKLDDPENPTNFPKDPTDNGKNDADYVTVKFVADANGKIKENGTVKEKGIAYAVLKNTEWADAVKGGVVVPTEFEGTTKFYTFKEWQKDGAKVTDFAKVDADVTYTAVFEKANEFSVTYNLNAPEGLTVGGTAPTDTDKYLKDEQVTVKALAADNTLAGYKFTGWNTQADGKGTAYAADAKFAIKANTELFAQWEKTAKDVIPVDNENDKTGKNGEEIPDNYVFVEFKVKDTDADKANIKADQQAKFKVDPKATVTLTAPELEVKDKVSHIASFNQADYTNKKFEQATTIWAVVAEKGKVKVNYVFKTEPADKTLPKALADLKPVDITEPIYEGKVVDPAQPDVSNEPAKSALVESVNGEKVGTWSIVGKWEKSSVTKDSITYTLTWKFTEPGRSLTPSINPVKPDDKTITGKGEPGSEVKVTIPGVKDPIPAKVDQNGDWTVKVPDNIHLKDGDVIKATQKTGDLKESDPAKVTVQRERSGGFFFFPAAPTEEKPETAIHKAYIFGYEDDSFKPEGNMTRAEAAAMLARLQGLDLSNEARPDFMDVRSGWYNGSINAVVNAGYMKGYPDNTFRPNGKITRAEFAQMIKAIDKANTGVAPFADVKGHWAEVAIDQAYANGRIAGYPDSTFRPNNNITRAEAVTVFNKLYDRSVSEAGLVNVKNSLVDFNDISRGHWAYYQVVEASNTHEYYRTVKDKVDETWVKIIQTWKDILAHR